MIKSFICRVLLALAILLPAANAMSEDISFDYLQIAYISSTVDLGDSIDEVEVDGNGIGFTLSLSFEPAFAMRLAVASTTFDTFQGMGVDTSKTTTLGVTAHTSIASGTDIFGNLSIVKAEITKTDGSDTDIGGVVDIGVRHRFTEVFEVGLGASKMYVFDSAVNTYEVNTRFYFHRAGSVGLGYTVSDDVRTLILNARVDI